MTEPTANPPAKKPYVPPALIEHGTVRDLTLQTEPVAEGTSQDL